MNYKWFVYNVFYQINGLAVIFLIIKFFFIRVHFSEGCFQDEMWINILLLEIVCNAYIDYIYYYTIAFRHWTQKVFVLLQWLTTTGKNILIKYWRIAHKTNSVFFFKTKKYFLYKFVTREIVVSSLIVIIYWFMYFFQLHLMIYMIFFLLPMYFINV